MPISKIKTSSILADAASTNLNIDAGTLFLDAASNRVGISTTSPTTKLHVTTAAAAALPATTGTTLATSTLIRLGTSSDSAGGIGTIGLSTNQMWIQVTDYTNLATGNALLLNPNGGNVGIGTTSPVYQTQIFGTGQTTAALTDAGNKGGSLLLNTPTVFAGDGGALLIGAGGSGAKPFAAIKGLLTDGGGNTTGALAFSTRNATADVALTERMRIDSSGNVGIGTTSPANKLEISGGSIRTINNTSGRITFNNGTTEAFVGFNGAGSSVLDAGALPLSINSQGANYITLNTNSSERMRITSGGAVGIGNSSPAAQNLHVGSGAGGATAINGYTRLAVEASDYAVVTVKAPAANFSQIIFADSATTNLGGINYFGSTNATPNAMAFLTGGGTERMRIDSSGFVGIGQTAPISFLDIYGNGAYTYSRYWRSDQAGYGARFGTADTLMGSAPARSAGVDGFSAVVFGIAGTEKARFDSSGNLGIGMTPSYKLDVTGSIRTSSVMYVTGGDGSIQRSGGNTWVMVSGNTGYGSNGVHLKLDSSTAAGGFYFFSQSTSILEIAGAGNTLVLQGGSTSAGTGIAFPATQSASSNANTLDDYEEGTWTPNIDSNNGTGTFTKKVGSYVKIGKQVTIWFVVDNGNSLANGTTQYLAGLPFAVSSSISDNTIVGHFGCNGPETKTNNLMTFGNRGVLYIYTGGAQQTSTISFAGGCATYWVD